VSLFEKDMRMKETMTQKTTNFNQICPHKSTPVREARLDNVLIAEHVERPHFIGNNTNFEIDVQPVAITDFIRRFIDYGHVMATFVERSNQYAQSIGRNIDDVGFPNLIST